MLDDARRTANAENAKLSDMNLYANFINWIIQDYPENIAI